MRIIHAAEFTQEQQWIIAELQKRNIYEETLTPLLVLMATCDFARSADDLAGIICEYPGIDNLEKLKMSIHKCIEEGYLKEKNEFNCIICYMDEEGYDRFVSALDKDIQDVVVLSRKLYKNTECVVNYGLLSGGGNGGKVNSTFIQRIKEAREEVLLPMLNTDAHKSTVDAILDRAEHGVKVKILLADYDKVVKKLRNKKESSIPQWVAACENQSNIEIRIYEEVEDAILSSSVIIDRCIVRMCVIDPLTQKTSNGTLIECYKPGYDLNITKLVCDKFDDIWERARPINQSKYVKVISDPFMWTFSGIVLMMTIFFFIPGSKGQIVMSTLFGMLLTTFVTQILQKIKKAYRETKIKKRLEM